MSPPRSIGIRNDASYDPAASWVGPQPPSGGLHIYLRVISSRLRLVAVIVVTVVGVAAVLVLQAEKVYQAEADLLISPVPRNNPNLYGLGLVTETGDPTRDAETLSQLITTPVVAERVRNTLGLETSAGALLGAVRAEPVAQSSIVTIIAETNDPEFSAQLANAFARAAVEVRTERLRELLDDLIPSLRSQLASVPQGEVTAREALSGRLRELQALRLLSDPTLHLETPAAAPNSPIAPRPLLTMVAAIIGGLVLGVGVVLVAHVLDPRVEREDDLRRYRIPILARVPFDGSTSPLPTRLKRRGPLAPADLGPSTLDAYRRLGVSLAARRDSLEPTFFVTSPGPGDGKSTTSFNLASAFATIGDSVVLLDADLRRPSIAGLLRQRPPFGLQDVLENRVSVAEALYAPYVTNPEFEIVAQLTNGGLTPGTISSDRAKKLLGELTQAAQWLVIDGPALNYAPEALPLAKLSPNVIVVVRLQNTRTRDLADLADLFVQQGIVPAGFIIVGGKPLSVYPRVHGPSSSRATANSESAVQVEEPGGLADGDGEAEKTKTRLRSSM